MQIILSDEEIETIYDSLLTHVIALHEAPSGESIDGKDGIIGKYIKRTEALIERFEPYKNGKKK